MEHFDKKYRNLPLVTIDPEVMANEGIGLIVGAWDEACDTVDRLSGDARKAWPGAIEKLHYYGARVRLRWRSERDEQMFIGVILGARERATGYAGTVRTCGFGRKLPSLLSVDVDRRAHHRAWLEYRTRSGWPIWPTTFSGSPDSNGVLRLLEADAGMRGL